MKTARQLARALNAQHLRSCAGFYGSGNRGGRYFRAKAAVDAVLVSQEFEGNTWILIPLQEVATAFADHNGRPIKGLA